MSKTLTPTEALTIAGNQLRAHLKNYLDELKSGKRPDSSFVASFDNCVQGYESWEVEFWADFAKDDDGVLIYVDPFGIGSDFRTQEWYDMSISVFREFMDDFAQYRDDLEKDRKGIRETEESLNDWLNRGGNK